MHVAKKVSLTSLYVAGLAVVGWVIAHVLIHAAR